MKRSLPGGMPLACIFFLFFSSNLFAQLPSYLPANGLVAWYPFNGNANDESGNGNDATLVTYNNGNASYYFVNSDSDSTLELQLLNEAFLQGPDNLFGINQPLNSFTIHTVVKPWNLSLYPTLFSISLGQYINDFIYNSPRIGAAIGTSGEIQFFATNSIYGNYVVTSPTQIITENSWSSIEISYNQGEVIFYVNGIPYLGTIQFGTPFNLHCGISSPGQTTFFSPLFFEMGSPFNSSIAFDEFRGVIKELAFYNRSWTNAEALNLAENNLVNSTPAPPGIPYQAEVRNDSGEILANASVNVRFTLHELTANGTVSYQETHAVTTNELGLFAATIGAGTTTQGTFAGINWAQTTKFLQVEVDAGTGYITMGNQQLMSVPYALYAANGPAGPQGPAGADGQNGIDGQNGVSIYNAYIENGQLYLVLTDNTIISAGSVNNGGGCTNPSACNFNPYYNYDNGSCYYPGYPCDDNNPATQGEVYDQYCQCAIAVPGCTSSVACNYNPEANQDDGSCITTYGPCSDGNNATVNDYINEDCQCVGFTSIATGTIGNGVTDATGNNYPTVIIGGQEWMAENLRTTKYANGDLIGYNLTPVDWANTAWGAWTSARENVAGSNEI